MNEINSAKPIPKPAHRVIILVIGDFLTFLLFAWIGRRSHALSVTDMGAMITTAAPFIISLFVISPWFGLYNAEVSQNWRKWVPRLLIAWVIGAPLAQTSATLGLRYELGTGAALKVEAQQVKPDCTGKAGEICRGLLIADPNLGPERNESVMIYSLAVDVVF